MRRKVLVLSVAARPSCRPQGSGGADLGNLDRQEVDTEVLPPNGGRRCLHRSDRNGTEPDLLTGLC
jgi:hypothetical protein